MYLLSRVMVWSIGVESWSGFLECVLEWNKVRFFLVSISSKMLTEVTLNLFAV